MTEIQIKLPPESVSAFVTVSYTHLHADSAYIPSVDHVGLIYGIFCSALYDAAKP